MFVRSPSFGFLLKNYPFCTLNINLPLPFVKKSQKAGATLKFGQSSKTCMILRFDFHLIYHLQILCVCVGLKLNHGKLLHLEAIKHLHQVLEIFWLLRKIELSWKQLTQNGDILKLSISVKLLRIRTNRKQKELIFFLLQNFAIKLFQNCISLSPKNQE